MPNWDKAGYRWLWVIPLLTLVFLFNLVGSAPKAWFATFDRGSEALVICSMIHARSEGPVGLGLGAYGYGADDWPEGRYQAFSKGEGVTNQIYDTYKSQFGLQGHLYDAIYRLTGVRKLKFYHLISSTLLAIVFYLLILAVRAELGVGAALGLLLSAICSPWLVGAAKDLYWSPWTWFLPILTAMIVLGKNKAGDPRWLFAYFLSLLVRFLCGYEYVSTILIAAFIPFVYVSVRDRRPLSRFIIEGIRWSVLSISALITAFLIHAIAYSGNLAQGLALIVKDAKKRTSGLPGVSETMESINASRWHILHRYFFEWRQVGPFSFHVSFTTGILVFSTCSLYLCQQPERRGKALGYSFFFSWLAPLSWLILAKQHSFMHPHLIFVLWSVPTLLLGGISFFYVIESALPARLPWPNSLLSRWAT